MKDPSRLVVRKLVCTCAGENKKMSILLIAYLLAYVSVGVSAIVKGREE